ncbi:hypothetical protein niasHT_029889 [Heterodera trifolii]|uniref:Protein kinase domain-containing protein n=1 Tax=Heterodera trifolii TaxID=157864 RepID=A0ABD2KBM9_9BILA
MSLLGRGLFGLMSRTVEQDFNPGTAIGVAIQLLHALKSLHSVGYLHLDVKPENAAIGQIKNKDHELDTLPWDADSSNAQSASWTNETNERKIGKMKRHRLSHKPKEVQQRALHALLKKCPPIFNEILLHNDDLAFYEQPKYEWIELVLRGYLIANDIPETPCEGLISRPLPLDSAASMSRN